MADASVSSVQQPGVRAHAYHVRNSAYKAREVLNLIRGKSYADANDILAFSSRAIAKKINKVLNSAVANAEHNSGFDADELYVSGCYANEGPTLKRWRPRAQGRASPILKRTCHITVIVSRYGEEQLDNMRERGLTRTPKAAAESRRRRVARSRKVQEKAQETAQAPEVAAVAAATDSRVAASDAEVEQVDADASTTTDTVTDETSVSEDSETSDYTSDVDAVNDPNNVDDDSTDTDDSTSSADDDNQDESGSSGQGPEDSSAERTV